jgi:protoheme IX farnesyltransferase
MTGQPTLKAYYHLTKPGIIYGNLFSAGAGFLLASSLRSVLDFRLFLAAMAGTALVIASGCVFNNYIDRDVDKKMARTQKRALVRGEISGPNALVYATVLGVAGFLVLVVFTNMLTVATGFVGIFFYVVVYGFVKRQSTLGTVVGSIPGATPPVAGYLAVTNHLDLAALLLFLTMAIWQMPHFYAIAIFRLKEYAAAGLPVLTVKKGIKTAKLYILLYTLAYAITVPLLTVFGYTGLTYLTVMVALSVAWLFKEIKGFNAKDDVAWARKMFGFSLIVLLGFSVMVSTGALLP